MFTLLKGIKVIDLTTIVLGPYATQLLGDFGAEIIKVENISGDLFRSVRPGRSPEMGAGFVNCNRNKQSVSINLKTPEGIALLYNLVKEADVVVHNMRSKTARRLGVSYDDLKGLNDKLVYCSAPGFGQHGPYADKPAYDDIIQAQSGIASLNADANGQPRFIPTILCDKVGGLHLAQAVMGGLIHLLRTNQGCEIEAPMFEGMVSFLMAEQLAGKSFIPALGGTGYERLMSPYRKPFPTLNGFISILPYNTKHWLSFLSLAGRDDMANAEIVIDPVKRSENINQLYKLISEVTPTRSTEAWYDLLNTADIPCAPVNKISDVLDDEHLQKVGFFTEYQHPSEGLLRAASSPFYVKGVPEEQDRAAPLLGQDTLSILQAAGLSEQQINDLYDQGVIKLAESERKSKL